MSSKPLRTPQAVASFMRDYRKTILWEVHQGYFPGIDRKALEAHFARLEAFLLGQAEKRQEGPSGAQEGHVWVGGDDTEGGGWRF